MTLLTLDHLLVEGRCHSRPTLLPAHVLETSMQFLRSVGDESLAKTAIMSSAGRREMGEMRFCSSMARRRASSSESGESEGASDESESLDCSMTESLSSSSKPRSGDVEADESERSALASLSRRLGCLTRAMFACWAMTMVGREGVRACVRAGGVDSQAE